MWVLVPADLGRMWGEERPGSGLPPTPGLGVLSHSSLLVTQTGAGRLFGGIMIGQLLGPAPRGPLARPAREKRSSHQMPRGRSAGTGGERGPGPQLLARPAREAALVALEVGGPRGCGFPRATQSRPGASSQDVAPQGGRRGPDSPEARGEGWKDVAGKPRSPDPQPWSLPPVPGPAHQVQIRRQGPASGSGPAGSADRAPPPGPGNRRPRPHAACGADPAWRCPGDAPGVPAPHHLRAPPRRGRGPPAPNAQALLLC